MLKMALCPKKPSLWPCSRRCPSHSRLTSSSSRRCAKSKETERRTSRITRLTFCPMRVSSGRLSTRSRSKSSKTKPSSKSSDISSTSGPSASGRWANRRPPRSLESQSMMRSCTSREVSGWSRRKSIFSVTVPGHPCDTLLDCVCRKIYAAARQQNKADHQLGPRESNDYQGGAPRDRQGDGGVCVGSWRSLRADCQDVKAKDAAAPGPIVCNDLDR